MQRRGEFMSLNYKIDVLDALKKKGYTSTKIRKEKIIGQATLQRLRHKQSVSFDVLSKLCEILECDVGDILEYVAEPEPAEQTTEPIQEENI